MNDSNPLSCVDLEADISGFLTYETSITQIKINSGYFYWLNEANKGEIGFNIIVIRKLSPDSCSAYTRTLMYQFSSDSQVSILVENYGP